MIYMVTASRVVSADQYAYFEVEADTEEEARALAKEELDCRSNALDWTDDVVFCVESEPTIESWEVLDEADR